MNYHTITYPDQNNGDGLRVVLWLSGCSHHCYNCQNPQTWDANSGIPFDESVREELFRELDKDYISGLTLTGGDPLHEVNLDGVLDIVTEFNKRYKTTQDIVCNKEQNRNILNQNSDKIRLSFPNKSIWIYSGFTWNTIWDDTLKKMIENGIGGLSLSEECENTLILVEKRRKIISLCDVIVDGKYIDSQRNPSKKWAGSDNQKVINIQQSIQKGEVILYE